MAFRIFQICGTFFLPLASLMSALHPAAPGGTGRFSGSVSRGWTWHVFAKRSEVEGVRGNGTGLVSRRALRTLEATEGSGLHFREPSPFGLLEKYFAWKGPEPTASP